MLDLSYCKLKLNFIARKCNSLYVFMHLVSAVLAVYGQKNHFTAHQSLYLLLIPVGTVDLHHIR